MTTPVQPHLVHIGYHKTATNWFQREYYPRITNRTYVSRKKVRRALIAPGAFQFDAETARRELGGDDQPLILCEEELSGNIHSGGLHGCLSKDVAHRIHAALPEAQIAIFIRSQPDIIASVYLQYIREGGTYGPARYLFPYEYLPLTGFSPQKVPLFSFDHFDYAPLITHYIDLFGADRVHVFPYEAFRAEPRAFVERYGARLGLELDRPDAMAFDAANPSYRRPILWAARALNHFTYQNVVDKRYVIHVPFLFRNRGKILRWLNRFEIFGRPPRPEQVLGPTLYAKIADRYRASNRHLIDTLGLPLAEHGYPC